MTLASGSEHRGDEFGRVPEARHRRITRDLLRSLPVFTGAISEFDTEALPDDPVELFSTWLLEAVHAGVPEPHAMTLSTSDATGVPDARTLILKDLDEQGWWFATNAESVKGIQLTARPTAALTFYWPLVARQIRARGPVVIGPDELSAADFRSRGTAARAVALVSHESQHLSSRATCTQAVAEAERHIAAHPDIVLPSWRVYAVAAHTVEFWQADKDRQHIRVQYRHHEDGWTHMLLWP